MNTPAPCTLPDAAALIDGMARALAAGAAPAVQAHAEALMAALRRMPPGGDRATVLGATRALRQVREQLVRRSTAVDRELATLMPERSGNLTYDALRPGARQVRN